MEAWKKVLVNPSHTIFETMKVIDQGSLQIAIVVDENESLCGLVTDGDIRRGILRGIDLSSPVSQVMNKNPIVVNRNTNPSVIQSVINKENIKHIPIVDDYDKLVDVFLTNNSKFGKYDNLVVLMAGGMGTRLRPLTNNIPKPLLKVGDKPILETIIQNFYSYGFRNFAISVNYKKELIKDYFGDGSRFDVNISYIDEEKRLGTAGALSLLPEKQEKPIIVMNGDLLTKVNYAQLLNFHEDCQSVATMGVREYEFQVPYGVIKTNNHSLISIEEKPIERYFVNSGIYVLNPIALDYIPFNQFYDMPQLFTELIQQKKETSVFPIREYWMDIGRIGDYEQANLEYSRLFC